MSLASEARRAWRRGSDFWPAEAGPRDLCVPLLMSRCACVSAYALLSSGGQLQGMCPLPRPLHHPITQLSSSALNSQHPCHRSEAAGQPPDTGRRMVLLRLATAYSSSLMHAPIPTKALTAALVGLTGDALAQGADADV